MRKKRSFRGIRALLLCAAAAFILVLPFSALAQNPEQKTVRVGWYDSSFCYWDEFGRHCGIDAEYQEKISAYTGWTYEYVEDSWSNLFQMLKDGEIDLLSDVSYKPDRTEFMSFPDLPMGSEAYYIYIDAENREITAENPASFNGKRIGVNKGSIQEGFLSDWAERNGLSIEIVPMDLGEAESLDLLMRGEIDGYTTVYSFGSEQKIVPVSRVGASDYYYAVNKNRPDLLTGENMPLSFAVNRADRELYFILNKTAVMTDSADMDSALASYMHADQKVSFAQFLKEHWLSVVLSLLAVFTVIIVLLLQKLKEERTANLTARMVICMRTRTS